MDSTVQVKTRFAGARRRAHERLTHQHLHSVAAEVTDA
jgi:hypothetical protein